MLLKAVALARLRSDTTSVIVSETMMAFSGIGVPIVVILRSQPENGSPSSRANAQACRDPAARTLRLPQMLNAVIIETMAMVPPVLPVALWKTSRFGQSAVADLCVQQGMPYTNVWENRGGFDDHRYNIGDAKAQRYHSCEAQCTFSHSVSICVIQERDSGVPLSRMVVTIMRGTVEEAFRTSSAISGPRSASTVFCA